MVILTGLQGRSVLVAGCAGTLNMGYSLLLCQGETLVATIEVFTSNQPNAGLRPAIWSRGQARLVSWVASPSPSSPIKGGINNFSYRSGILQMGPRSPSGSVYPWRKGSGGSTIPWRSRHSLAAKLSLLSGSGSIKYHSDFRPSEVWCRHVSGPVRSRPRPPWVRFEPTIREGLGMPCHRLFLSLALV